MKTLRQTCAVAVLTLLLSVSLFAGQVNCPGYVPPPPPETTLTSDITTSIIVALVGLIN